jgi:hypothetical protein
VRTSPPLRQFHRACKSLLVMLLVIFELRLPTGSRQLLLFASLTVVASTVTLYAFYLCRLIEIGPSPSVLLRVVTLCNPTSHTNGERRSPHTSNRGSHPYCPLHVKASRLLICGCTRAHATQYHRRSEPSVLSIRWEDSKTKTEGSNRLL